MTRESDWSDVETLTSVDQLIHAPARLAIVTVLTVAGEADFVSSRNRLG